MKKGKRGRPKGTIKEPTKQIRIPLSLEKAIREIINLIKSKK